MEINCFLFQKKVVDKNNKRNCVWSRAMGWQFMWLLFSFRNRMKMLSNFRLFQKIHSQISKLKFKRLHFHHDIRIHVFTEKSFVS